MKSLLFGISYLLLYCVLAFFTLGARHGTNLFLAPLMPYGLGFVLLLFIIYLFDKLNSGFERNIYLALMTIHHLATFFWLAYCWSSENDDEYLIKTWKAIPEIVLLTVGWYLLGQIIIWANFYKHYQQKKAASF